MPPASSGPLQALCCLDSAKISSEKPKFWDEIQDQTDTWLRLREALMEAINEIASNEKRERSTEW